MSSSEPIPEVNKTSEESNASPPSYLDTVSKSSTVKVSSSLWVDVKEFLGPIIGPLLCCILIIVVIVLVIYFVWPLLTSIMGFAGDIVADAEQDLITAGKVIEHGLYEAETLIVAEIKAVDGFFCSSIAPWYTNFAIGTAVSALLCPSTSGATVSNLACCQEWYSETLALLIQNGISVSKVCRYAELTSGLSGYENTACSGYSACRWGFQNGPDGSFPGDFRNWLPSRSDVITWGKRPALNKTYFFHPSIKACGFVPIFWVDDGEVNPLH